MIKGLGKRRRQVQGYLLIFHWWTAKTMLLGRHCSPGPLPTLTSSHWLPLYQYTEMTFTRGHHWCLCYSSHWTLSRPWSSLSIQPCSLPFQNMFFPHLQHLFSLVFLPLPYVLLGHLLFFTSSLKCQFLSWFLSCPPLFSVKFHFAISSIPRAIIDYYAAMALNSVTLAQISCLNSSYLEAISPLGHPEVNFISTH